MGGSVEVQWNSEDRMIERSSVRYYIDENLSSQIPRCLRHIGYSARRVPRNEPDDLILDQMSGERTVFVTGDRAMQSDFDAEIRRSGASVAWVWCNHSDPATQYFAVLTFVTQLHAVIASADIALYYDVRIGTSGGLSAVRIDPAQY